MDVRGTYSSDQLNVSLEAFDVVAWTIIRLMSSRYEWESKGVSLPTVQRISTNTARFVPPRRRYSIHGSRRALPDIVHHIGSIKVIQDLGNIPKALG